MQIVSPLRGRLPEFRRAACRLKLWVLELCAWALAFAGGRAARLALQRHVRAARQEARILIFLAVVAQLDFTRRPQRICRHPPTGRGFRFRARRIDPLAAVTRGVGLRTLRDIRRALERFDAVVARALKRAPKPRGIAGRIVAVRPRAHALVAQTFGVAREAADTS